MEVHTGAQASEGGAARTLQYPDATGVQWRSRRRRAVAVACSCFALRVSTIRIRRQEILGIYIMYFLIALFLIYAVTFAMLTKSIY